MMSGDNVEYIRAYTEIKCLLKYFPIKYVKKLPDKLLEDIYINSDDKYNIDIDLEKDLKSQNISKKTKDILSVLTYNYWANEETKKIIAENLNKNEKQYKEELKKKYSYSNIFKNDDTKEAIEDKSIIAIEKKESLFMKIKNWFLRFKNK